MVSIFQEITNSKEVSDWIPFLTRLKVHKVFEPLFNIYTDKSELKAITQYVVYAYSLDSTMLTTSREWSVVSLEIADKVGFEEKLRKQICNLDGAAIIDAIENFLTYQNDEKWTQYIHYRDLRKRCLRDALDPANDLKSSMSAVENAEKLLEKMEAVEASFVRNNHLIKAQVQKLDKVKETFSVENLLKISNNGRQFN